jgi:exonuclease III
MGSKVKIIQINAHKDKTATTEVMNLMNDENFQIALVQEPYCYKKGLGNFTIPNLGSIVLIAEQSQKFYSFILCNNPRLNILHLSNISTSHITVISLQRTDLPLLFIISVYSPPSPQHLRETTRELQHILGRLHGHSILLCGDFNSRSVLWHDRISDNNCQLLEDFILTNDLAIFNEGNFPPTFQTVNGSSNIDLTLGSYSTIDDLDSWAVLDNVSSSDHRPITFNIRLCRSQTNPKLNKRVEYCDPNMEEIGPRLGNMCSGLLERYPVLVSPRKIDLAISEFYTELEMVLQCCARTRRSFAGKPEWWNRKVEKLRKTYLAKKTSLYKNKNPAMSDILFTNMKTARERFKSEIKKAQERSWKEFVKNDLGPNPWGVVYKLAAEKLRRTGPLGAFKNDEGTTLSKEEAMSYLLHSLLPDDVVAGEDATHRDWRQDFEAIQPGYHNNTMEVTEEEVYMLVSSLKSRKAPGTDKIRGRILKIIMPEIAPFLVHVYNSCLKSGYFPQLWKVGDLKVLPKNPTGDPSSTKNYRPITLLSELGKIFEKIIKKRLFINRENLHSPSQYGFVPGRSTTDALLKYQELVTDPNFHQCATVFADISGAFDNVWWPAMIKALRRKNIPEYLIATVKSYVTDRLVIYQNGDLEVRKTCTKGCPQGSVLGPTLWNLVLDVFLEEDLPEEVKVIAYADDIALIIRSNSRKQLRGAMQRAVEVLDGWAYRNKLTISTAKSKIMVHRPNRKSHNRDLRVVINNKTLGIVKEMRYLGILIDPKLNFNNHIRAVCDKAKKVLVTLRKKLFLSWGDEIVDSLHTIYKCGIIPIVAYASEVWAHRLAVSKNRRKLEAVYGLAAKIIISGYSSVSHEAAGVIAGILPLDLQVGQQACRNALRRVEVASFHHLQINRRDFDSPRHLGEFLALAALDIWQHRWESSLKGRTTFSFFPQVPGGPRFNFTKKSTQVLTGHGNFVSHLWRIGKVRSDNCNVCGRCDDPIHRIQSCPLFAEDRATLEDSLGYGYRLPDLVGIPMEHLEGFAKDTSDTTA